VTPVLTLIDVGQNPDLKALFLSGRVNIAVCPQCGNAGMLSAPLVYHDPDKELLFTFIPSELGASDTEQQQVVGELTNRVISALPAEKRKGYLLRPRSFMRLEGMIDAILEADGITPEMLSAQRAKAQLLDRLLSATSADARQVIAQENDSQIDYEFFQLLTLNIELAQSGGEDEIAQELLELRAQLLEWTTQGQTVAAREEAIRSLGGQVSREELLDKVVQAALAGQGAKVEAMVSVARPAIDYVFYQQLSARIEAAEKAADAEQAETLKALRETILDLTAQIDSAVEQLTAQAMRNLQQVLDSDDPEEALRADPAQIDDFFLSVLASRMQAAEQADQPEEAEKLSQINDVILKLIQESQPPEIQFVNRLLGADYPDATAALLEENRGLVSADLLEIMERLGQELTRNGQETLAQKLAQIQNQATAMLQ
jgi:hypothetical protein